MDEEVRTSIRVPIQAVAEALRARHELTDELVNVRLEGDTVVFEFKRTAPVDSSFVSTVSMVREVTHEGPSNGAQPIRPKPEQRQRKQARRNRMKTKGWAVVAKIDTARGHTAMVYEPLVKELERPLSPTQQRAIVGRLLRENGNDPSEASIEYYLQSTLEYIEKKKATS